MLVVVDLHFIFDLHFVVVSSFLFWSSFCCCTSFITVLHSHLLFEHHPSPFRGLSPGFCTYFILSAQPIAGWFATLSFSIISLSSYRRRYGFQWAFFTHRRLFTLRFFTDIFNLHLLRPPPGSSSFRFAGLHADPGNTDPARLFVWFTLIHTFHTQNDSVLNSTIY